MSALRRYGEDTWFRLGDQDLATHLLRTQRLNKGERLTDITRRLCEQLKIRQRILPMSDAEVATRIDTLEHGELEFQVYFVKHRWQPVVKGLRLAGIENAQISPEVETAIDEANIILIGPSNPWLSIQPILSVPGLRDALVSRNIPRVAVTPIIQGQAVKGPASKLMAELGYKQSVESVVHYYGEILNGFVYDLRDGTISRDDMRSISLDTLMLNNADRLRLAREVLAWIADW
jgi:LPPG:FO 2-phospho-L-lactate transferase